MKPCPLPPGIYPQLYLDKIQGRPAQKTLLLDGYLHELKDLGCPGVAFHGFSATLPAQWDTLAALAARNGLLAVAAFGMDDTDPAGKGTRIAQVAIKPSCAAVIFDAEGRWEDEKADKNKALEMTRAFRSIAPNAYVFDQPWPVPTVHWSLFPWEEFADLADARAPQYYVNDWKGPDRYRSCWTKFDAAWAKLNERLAKTNHVRPVVPTIQGYGWDDIFADLCDCLVRNPLVFIWCEPFPAPVTLHAMAVVHALTARGFYGAGAIADFQAANGLASDGRVGPKTLVALGLQ